MPKNNHYTLFLNLGKYPTPIWAVRKISTTFAPCLTLNVIDMAISSKGLESLWQWYKEKAVQAG